ncbi:hypothetical protein [Thermogladius sp.]|uniref:hypothetical protein n=1 Tax=Thermogladius sp. TaxID=2023064 RepID=UPI003D0C3FDC
MMPETYRARIRKHVSRSPYGDKEYYSYYVNIPSRVYREVLKEAEIVRLLVYQDRIVLEPILVEGGVKTWRGRDQTR